MLKSVTICYFLESRAILVMLILCNLRNLMTVNWHTLAHAITYMCILLYIYFLIYVCRYRECIKMLGQTSRVSYLHQTKERYLYKHVWKWVVFQLNWKISLKNMDLNCLIVYLQLAQYIYKSCLQFENCWRLTFYQVTIYSKCSKCHPPESMHAWICLIVVCRTLSKVPGRLRMVWQASEDVGEVSSFSIRTE
jgi:hypothetical protein